MTARSERALRQRLFAPVLLGAVLLTQAACAPHAAAGQEQQGVSTKQSDGRLRTDLAPLAERYPRLDTAESVEWMSGTLGTSELGPSTYWVDVIAVMPKAEIELYRSTSDPARIEAPQIVDELRPRLPSGPFEGGPTLDDLFSTGGYRASVAIDPQTRTVVLSGVFE
jgi:hypothetical protein